MGITSRIDQVGSRIVKFIEWFCQPRSNPKKSKVPISKRVHRVGDELDKFYNDGNEDFEVIDSVGFDRLVVSETSSEHCIYERNYSVREDHVSISRSVLPKSRSAGSFQYHVRRTSDVLPPHSESLETPKLTRLNPSQILRPGDSRTSSNGVYTLVMQRDNNLVLKGPGRDVMWSSKTALHLPNCYCVMQTDGNAVIYAVQEGGHQTALWSTGTHGCVADARRYIEVQNDGNAVMYDERGRAVWATNTSDLTRYGDARLSFDRRLERGEFIMSPNGGYRLVMQEDCNLVLYCTSELRAVWASDTYRCHDQSLSLCYFVMQADGDAVVYAGNTTPLSALWSTKTTSQTAGTYYIQVQDDGNIVMYDDVEKPVWASGTGRERPNCGGRITSGQIMCSGDSRVSQNRRYILLMQWDGDLVLYKKGEGRIWASGTACQKYETAILERGTVKCYFIMTPNGSAEIYAGNKLSWSTCTDHATYGTYYIDVQNDGNVVMYDRGSSRRPLWATNTTETL